jgi:lipopolysaccharide transport system permease protein
MSRQLTMSMLTPPPGDVSPDAAEVLRDRAAGFSRTKGPAAAPAPAHEADAVEPPVTSIKAPKGWQPVDVHELWQFRGLLYFLTWRDVKVRYKQTALGVAWAVIQPAMMMVVFTVFFGKMVGINTGRVPYAVFSYLGLVPWTFFATAIANSGNSVVGSERLIAKVYFPRLAIPFAAVAAAVVDFFVAFGLLVVLMVWYGVMPGPNILLLPVIFLIIALLAAGVGTLLAALNVAYRDFRYVIPFLVQLWLFATPSVYMPIDKAMHGHAGPLLSINPMTWLIAAFRAACVGGPIPYGQLAIAAAVSVVTFVGGCLFFRRLERNFADVI